MYLCLPLNEGHLSNVATVSWQIHVGWLCKSGTTVCTKLNFILQPPQNLKSPEAIKIPLPNSTKDYIFVDQESAWV